MKETIGNIFYVLFATSLLSCGAQEVWLDENDTIIKGVVKVVDENNGPIHGASVEFIFGSTLRQKLDEKRPVSNIVKQVSNDLGEVSFLENALTLLVEVHMDGYWSSVAHIGTTRDINKLRQSDDPAEKGYWEIRWNPTIILPLKNNPRPMFAGEFRYSPLQLNETYAFDLEKNDWVRPNGKGEKRDIFFTLEGVAAATPQPPGSLRSVPNIKYDVTLTVHFPNKGDGILAVKDSEMPGSEILLGRVAPADGYQEQLLIRRSTEIPRRSDDELAGYWFRVRTKTDPVTGEVIQGHYGKFKRDFRFGFNYIRTFQGSLVFEYMFSPDTQRSMEFNGENLLKDGHWSLGNESR